MQTAEPLVPEPRHFDFEIAIAQVKSKNRRAVIKFR
jgi:hypothetical protein